MESRAERLVLVMSDVEMGAGPVDDFPHDAFLADLLWDFHASHPDLPLHYVFNGDTFDFLKVPYQGSWTHRVTVEVALAELHAVAEEHPRFVEVLGRIARAPGPPRRFHFVVGNHDAELLFPEVQEELRRLSGAGPALRFPGFSLSIGPVRFEHGHQQDPLFRVDPRRPFVTLDGQRMLNLAWASVALLDAVMPLAPDFAFYESLRPRELLMELVPQFKELLLARFWRYWTRDFWKEFLSIGNPLVRLEWSMVKEVFRRMTTADTDVNLDPRWLRDTVERGSATLHVLGHLHQSGSRLHGTRRILQLGCMRDEFWIEDDGWRFRPVLKHYAELGIQRDRVVTLVQRELLGPGRGGLPESVWSGLPAVERALAALGDRKEQEARRKAQERAEARRRKG